MDWKVTPVTMLPPPVMNVTVLDRALLRGEGVITTIVANAGAAVAPGNIGSVGMLTVTDSVLFNTDSGFFVQIDGNSGSFLDIGGIATIDSNVDIFIVPQAGQYVPANHLILSAGTLVGEFVGLTVPVSYFLGHTLSYDIPNNIILSITPRTVVELTTGANAIAVANSLDKVIDWNRTHVNYEIPSMTSAVPSLLENVLSSLESFITVEEMTDAVNQLQPAFFKGFTIVQENNIVKVQDTLSLRMEYVLNTKSCYAFAEEKECCDKDLKPIHTWISGLGDVLAQKSNTFEGSPQVGYQSKMGGFTAGVDGRFAKVVYLGAMGGYTTSYIKWRGHQGTGNINTGYAGLYLSA